MTVTLAALATYTSLPRRQNDDVPVRFNTQS
jgi:hypothetical protein